MNRILALSVVRAFMASGCGEEEKEKVASAQKANSIKHASVVQKELVPIRSQTVASYGGA
jgi:hypothetical protein